MRFPTILALSVLALIALHVAPACAQAPAANGDAARCETLKTSDFSTVEDAPTQIIDTEWVSEAGSVPAYCRVHAYVSPQVGVELWLPATNWNGKFLMTGCGALCGSTRMWVELFCADPLRKGYACVGTDMGHQSTFREGIWAKNNLQAKIDFGYRATHVAALAGKAITDRYYRSAPRKSYFVGCSTGGRQALVEAQRFPWDFDGIVAGAPALNMPGLVLHAIWDVLTLQGKGEKPLIDAATLELAHRKAVTQCDLQDGLKDGLIEDPLSCKIDPSKWICASGATAECVSAEQAQALQKMYAGPTIAKGEIFAPGGVVPGSELHYRVTLGIAPELAEFVRYVGLMTDPGPAWQLRDLDWDRDSKRFGVIEGLLSASNPDLRNFKSNGGKLLLYDGWNDEHFALNTVDYYQTVVNTMGGRGATQDFLRFFMVPGMDHCSGGEGAFAIDYLSYLEAWVEKGQAPNALIGAHISDANLSKLSFPLDDSLPLDFTRPVFPFPQQARFKGKGDPNKAENFTAVPRAEK